MQEYPVGTPGVAWSEAENKEWFNRQSVKRSYQDEVVNKYSGVSAQFESSQYGSLPINNERYPLFGFTSSNFNSNNPSVLISGGVHGYETSGVQGAIDFLLNHAKRYIENFNFIIVPCVSPWAYETINRWTTSAIDPNRSFFANSPSPEAQQLMSFVHKILGAQQDSKPLLAHIDLHETTDSDNSEFRPALAARDGVKLEEWEVPDGFYTVADTAKPQLDFQKAIIDSVRKVTHIAPSDANQQIIGADVVSPGVICYDKSSLFLCGGFTKAPYVTTTEVYPDSPNATPEICIAAQVAAITGALDYLMQLSDES